MTADDRLLAAFLGLAVGDRPELAALQVAVVPAVQPIVSPSRPTAAIEQEEAPRPSLRVMVDELQAAHPERAPGEPGWEATRPAWPDSWFDARDPGDVSACRKLWASVLLACIRDVVQDLQGSEGFDQKRVPVASSSWIGSRDFHEVCALAGVDGVAVADRLARLGDDRALRDRILNAHADRSVLSGEARDA